MKEIRILALIPARGGSKGVPRKNLREVAGKPLLAWTIEAAKKVSRIDQLVLSSEDAEIISLARELGCEVPFVRPAELARDETSGIDPVLHAIDTLSGFTHVILLQPTSPLRTAKDIEAAIALSLEWEAPCVSVAESPVHPRWMFELSTTGVLTPFLKDSSAPPRRQDLSPVFVPNGAIYVASCDTLRKARSFLTPTTRAYVMPAERSLDIDTDQDLQEADRLLKTALRQ